ncbi:MAG: DUF3488 domain-containing protein [Acidimicrobiia bacterium]|nr:DUF3488 domain-containing protein [Acidimicrobiia bacterium]
MTQSGSFARLRRRFGTPRPEGSLPFRATVLAAILVAATAVLREVGAGPRLWMVVWLGIPAGFVWSHRRRFERNLWLKALLALAVLVAFANFLRIVSEIAVSGAAQLQLPLAELFVWVQFLHSLDVPSRRDLLFSLSSSAALMIVAAVLAMSMQFGVFLAVWGVAALASLGLAYRSRLAETPGLDRVVEDENGQRDVAARTAVLSFGRSTALAAVVVACAATFVFALLPRTQATTAFSFPAALRDMVRLPGGGLANPTLGGGGESGRGPTQAELEGRAAFGYFGFATEMDTALRGRPDDTLVMRVRSSEAAFWRGQTFDTWDGRRWTVTRDRPDVLAGRDEVIDVPLGPYDTSYGTRRLVQTYHVEVPGPNIIFAAYAPERLYFPDNAVFQLPDGSLRAGVELGTDAVYTVVSTRHDVTVEMLRASDSLPLGIGAAGEELYTRLPEIPARVRDLAADVTATAPTTYDKVMALQRWLAENTTYSLDIPPLPEGADTVDHFLFVEKRGFCEQIGSSLVVMLRSLGIPARLTVGYLPGDRNPFSGMFEVRARDAHAWAEVWFPGVGWQGFDPTAEVPLAGEGPGLAGTDLVAWAGAAIPGLVRLLPGAAVLLAFVFVAWGARALVRDVRRRHGLRRSGWAAREIGRLERAGRRMGRIRGPTDTTPEFVADLGARTDLPAEEIERLSATLEAASFGPTPPSEAERERAEVIAATIGRQR